MQRLTVVVVSDHPQVLESLRVALKSDFEVLTLHPHLESVVAVAGALQPQAVIVDLSRRSVRCGAMVARLIEEIPDVRLVVLLDREARPDVKRRTWLESGLERDKLGPDLARCLDRAFGGLVRAVGVETRSRDESPRGPIQDVAYPPTFSC